MKFKKWHRNLKLEFWKTIEDYPNYMISSLGRVKSLNYNRTGKVKIMKPHLNNKGYLFVNLSNNGIVKKFYIHRLVAIAFIPNIENKPCIDHIDTNPLNNRIKNLRWTTQKENCNNPLSVKKYSKVNTGEKHPGARKVRCHTGEVFDCIKYACEWCGLKSSASIIRQIQNKTKSAGTHPVTGQKLTWEYVD